MSEFEDIDGTDGPEVPGKLASIKMQWDGKSDLRFWFFELELQMTIINIQSAWLKRVILANNLSSLVKAELKEFLMKPKATAGATIYKELKTELYALFAPKEEDSYAKAKQLLLTSKPSALLKSLAEELCDCTKKLENCCAAKTVSAMWRDQLPQQVKAAIAGISIKTPEGFKNAMKKADEVFATLKPPGVGQVSAVTGAAGASASAFDEVDDPDGEIAAFRTGGGRGSTRGNTRGQSRGRGGNRGNGQWRPRPQQQQQPQQRQQQQQQRRRADRHPDNPPENACSIHWKWGRSAFRCADTQNCPWKNEIASR